VQSADAVANTSSARHFHASRLKAETASRRIKDGWRASPAPLAPS
jgi:hypothetical protein